MVTTGETVSHYRILEKLGGGGMGVVYKAEDTRLGRTVALKVLPPERVADPNRKRRFIQEARAASALNHPNIITIYDIDEVEGEHFIAMEYVDGKTLDRLIAHGLSLDKALKYAVEMAAALAKAHSAGIVHRDLKPTNIMVNSEGLVKVLDFGLAKLTEPLTPGPSPQGRGWSRDAGPGEGDIAATAAETVATAEPRTEEGTVIGTVGYMSPEQAEGKPVDARSDIFSFGSVLYEMLAGQRAFQGETKVSTIAAILREEPKPLSQVAGGVPHEMERLVKRCLRKDRDHRFQTMADLKVALEELKEESDSGELAKAAAVAPLYERRPRFAGHRPALQWGLAAVVAVALVAAWIFTHRTPPPAPQITERRITANPSENPLTAGEISPDGKYLAYGDALGLHLKLIQSGETLNIPQPEGPGAPSTGSWWPNGWFPDGTKFITAGLAPNQPASAWAVSAMGGPPRKLRDEADPWSVSPDGTLIAFGTGSGFKRCKEVWLMGAQGEDARKFVSGSEDDAFFWAAWSPDGQRIAYKRFHRTPDGQECSIENRDLKRGQPTFILSGPTLCDRNAKFLWTPEGRFIYMVIEPDHKGFNLWEIRVDASTGKPSGSPRRLTNWEGIYAPHLSVSRDGKQLAVTRWSRNSDVYVAELEGNGRRLKNVRRLTLDENNDVPGQWMPDGKAVLFLSDRNGTLDIFKQRLDQTVAEPVATGSDFKESPVVSPDGSWILYLSRTSAQMAGTTPVRIMRASISGGAPQLVLEGRGISRLACAHSPATYCVFSEPTPDFAHLVFSAFDPNRGIRRELTRTSLRPNYLSSSGGPPANDWDVSWDGARLAFAQFDFNERRIRILPLAGGTAHDVGVEGSSGIGSVRWAADGKGLLVGVGGFASSRRPLLYVNLQGRTEVVWQQTGVGDARTVAVPSADGRHLAMLGISGNNNVWLLEGF